MIPFAPMLTALGVTFLLLTIVTAFAGLGREASAGMTRWMGMLCVAGVTLAVLMPTPWHGLLLLSIVLNVQRQHPPSSHIHHLETVLGVSGLYLVLTQYSWAWLIDPFLWTLASIGTYMGLWGMYSVLYQKGQPYSHTFGWAPFLQFTITEREHGRPGAKAGDIWCGQFMTNFTQAVLCVTIAATVGLVVTGYYWAAILVLPQLFPLFHYLRIHFGVGQWVVHLGVVALGVLGLYHPWAAVNLAVTGAAVFTLFLFKYQRLGWEAGGAGSGRLVEWRDMWHIWSQQGVVKIPYVTHKLAAIRQVRNAWIWARRHNWWVYLFGFGIRSWVQVAYDKALMKAKTTGQTSHNIFTMAHNEYIQQLFEFGLVGFIALIGLSVQVWSAAYTLHAGLWLVVLVLISIAQLSYPWAFYHRAVVPAVGAQGRAAFHEHRFGSPLLFWVSFLTLVLAHG